MTDSASFATKIRRALGACSLAPNAWPTALEPVPALAAAAGLQDLWLKREDRAGGNKVRGLEFLLGDTPPGSVLVTVGGTGSTHCLATARAARALGHRAAVALFPQPETDASRIVTAELRRVADLVVIAPLRAALPVALWRAWRGARRLGVGRGPRRWIPGGGATPRAVVGHMLGALELEAQMSGSAPDAIVAPLGTGGTVAGIALGTAWLGWPTRVIGVRVAPWIVANRWRTQRLARRAAALIGVEPGALAVEMVNGLGPGYGYPSAAGEQARRVAATHGLRLDPTYGAKAFAYVGEGRRVVFWHTFPWP